MSQHAHNPKASDILGKMLGFVLALIGTLPAVRYLEPIYYSTVQPLFHHDLWLFAIVFWYMAIFGIIVAAVWYMVTLVITIIKGFFAVLLALIFRRRQKP